MSTEVLLQVIFGLLMCVVGWNVKTLVGNVTALTAAVTTLRELLLKEYVSKEDYDTKIKELKDRIHKLEAAEKASTNTLYQLADKVGIKIYI